MDKVDSMHSVESLGSNLSADLIKDEIRDAKEGEVVEHRFKIKPIHIKQSRRQVFQLFKNVFIFYD
jgi:hypothetical protein